MATVWIPTDAGHDYKIAEEFGDVRYVFTSDDDISPFQTERAAKHVAKFFDVNPPQPGDYLLFAGPPLFIVCVFQEFNRVLPGIKLLIHHMRERKYIPRDLPVRK